MITLDLTPDENQLDLFFDAEVEPDYPEDNLSDVEADAMTLASAGMGTDEDYGYYGNDDGF